MNEKELNDIVNIIEDDNFKDVYYSDNYNEDGNAFGYAVVNGIGYSFLYNSIWGIYESSIEKDKDAFKYIKILNEKTKCIGCKYYKESFPDMYPCEQCCRNENKLDYYEKEMI